MFQKLSWIPRQRLMIHCCNYRYGHGFDRKIFSLLVFSESRLSLAWNHLNVYEFFHKTHKHDNFELQNVFFFVSAVCFRFDSSSFSPLQDTSPLLYYTREQLKSAILKLHRDDEEKKSSHELIKT